MPDQFHIRLAKERLVFCAAHFITYGDDVCEPLHGHNYHVDIEAHGPLDANGCVVDFIPLRDELQRIVDALDHRVLLPTEHPTIRVEQNGDEVVATHGDRRWVFPAGDCVLLSLKNTTAELLARHIGRLAADWLRAESIETVERIRVGVDECDGQWGVCEADI